jgi:hypothetical protein
MVGSFVEGSRMSWVSKSGAKSSVESWRFDLISPAWLRRLAARLAYGASKHGDPFNYRLGVNDDDYFRDRANHLIEHAFKLQAATTRAERLRQIEAISANAMMLDYLAEHGTEDDGASDPG